MTTRRALQAAETRADILRAARSLFAENGYAATSVKDIAAKANVSVQTVYDSVGSKADLVRGLNEHIDAEAGISELAMQIPVETDPIAVVTIAVRIARALVENVGDILRATASGSASEPALRGPAQVGFERHEAGIARLVGRLEALDGLRPGLRAEEATATIAVMTDGWFALRLVDDYGWTPERYETWAVETLRLAVLKA